jgi:ATP-dependent Clp protease protease subunit
MYIIAINGIIGEDFKMADALMHLHNAKLFDEVKLLINSPGGVVDEAEKIYNLFKSSGKIIHAENSGMVASAAVKLFCLAEKQNRIFWPLKGDFIIHNPWVEGSGVTGATAADLQNLADDLANTENMLAKSYAAATGTDINIIKGFMTENVPLTTEQIKELGFAEIGEVTLAAVAYFKPNNNNEDVMDKQLEEKLNLFESALNKVLAFIKPKPKGQVVQDVNGNQIDLGEGISDLSMLTVGSEIMVNGQIAPDGEYLMPDGTKIIVLEGKVSEIVVPNQELEALKKENEALKADLQGLTNQLAEVKKLASSYVPEGGLPKGDPEQKNVFKYNGKIKK